MPTYEYQCDRCRRTFEIRQRITAEPLTWCEVCDGTLRRLLAPAPFILKGEGWYVTDYPSDARKKAVESEKSSDKSGDKGGDKKDTASAEKSSTPSGTSTPTASGAPPSTSSSSS